MKKTTTITILILSILFVSFCTVAATYSVIIEVTEEDGLLEIVNNIKVKDLLTNDDGTYNQIYYDLKNELQITTEEADILLDSKEIDNALKTVLKSVAEYKVNNNIDAKLSDEEIYNLASNAILNTNNISDEVKSKIINKASIYRKDVSKYIYDIEVSILKDRV